MSTAADYVDRLVDVAAFRGIFPNNKEQLLAQEIVSSKDNGAILAGIEKLAQNVMIILFTIKGSKKYAPNEGCQFLLDAELGLWRTVADVTQSFYLARVDVKDQIIAKELSSDPLDELYGGLQLLGVTLAGDKVTIRIQLKSQAGTKYVFLTPLKVAIK